MKNIQQFQIEVTKRINQISQSENTSILEAANQFYKTYKNDGMIYIFGTGHSHMLAEEGHFRAGGFAPICPILFSGLMLHEGSLLSGEIERTEGIATRVLQNYKLKEKDTLMIFTNSGVNQAPLEAALYAKEVKCKTIGVSSLDYAKLAPKSKLNKRLDEVVNIYINNHGPPGDTLLSISDTQKVSPFSTISGAFILNSIIAHVAELCKEEELFPFFISANMPNASHHNEKLLEKYKARNPHI